MSVTEAKGNKLIRCDHCMLEMEASSAVTAVIGNETRHFVEQVRHTGGVGGTGTRSHLWLDEVADA